MTDIDWLTCEWSGLSAYEEDLPVALCGSWDCPGGCSTCWRIEQSGYADFLFLPILGPVNRDGTPLGYLPVLK